MSLRQRIEKEIREVARMELALLSNLSPAKKLELIGEIQERQTQIEIMRRANEDSKR